MEKLLNPVGSIDHPFNPAALALGADATFVARSMDRDPAHLQEALIRANAHKGTSFLEIYQNCNIFNDGAFEAFTEKATKKENDLFVRHGQPLVYGDGDNKGIKLDGFTPISVDLTKDDLWIHDETDIYKAQILARIFDNPANEGTLPRPFGIFYANSARPTYEDMMTDQLNAALGKGVPDLDKLLRGSEIWEIK